MQGVLKITLLGEVLDVEMFVGGIKIKLMEREEHQYVRQFSRFDTDGLLDVMLHLKGTEGTTWALQIEWEENVILSDRSVIGPLGYVEMKELLKLT